ncbi:hypothetical protein CF1_0118 [Staphylococcus phage CF1]|jgi:hypothetical protein|uniref:Uncharacterized protein n=2 Tax=Sextaecvirus TaxID=1922243 RepID=A0A060AFM1_9CAUD|nr:hypothetical protein PHAGE6E_138 [Staphylococcus phage 6ec]AIA64164.1 hypothetical protein PHAGE6E_138 [Staphylococcus phage 6ec]WRW34217.1 hypothetical protein CF1_0118 [Staphylococcus phage CF1]WRW34563.1 hypothetical protein CF9_0126 [Staphylococcus phage CF9]
MKLINSNKEIEAINNKENDFIVNVRYKLTDYITDCMRNNEDDHIEILKWLSTLEKCLICETVKDLINLINIYDLPFNIIK